MRKNFGKDSAVYPMPVFIVAAYDKDGKPNCMNAAWGGIYETNQVMVCISEGHKTTKNIKESKLNIPSNFDLSKSTLILNNYNNDSLVLKPYETRVYLWNK